MLERESRPRRGRWASPNPPPGNNDHADQMSCGKCGQRIKPRSIKPGALLCPSCREDALPSVVIYREPPNRREKRLRREADEDAARAARPRSVAVPELTPEHLIAIAWRNGALNIVAARLQSEAERDGRPVPDDDTAIHLAKTIIVDYGSTAGGAAGQPNYPHHFEAPGPSWQHVKLGYGPHLTGRRVRGAPKYVGMVRRPLTPRESGILKDAKDRVAKLRAAREVKAARAELEAAGAGNTAHQREAHILVRIEGLSRAEAGRRLGGITKQAVSKLLEKYDRAEKSTT